MTGRSLHALHHITLGDIDIIAGLNGVGLGLGAQGCQGRRAGRVRRCGRSFGDACAPAARSDVGDRLLAVVGRGSSPRPPWLRLAADPKRLVMWRLPWNERARPLMVRRVQPVNVEREPELVPQTPLASLGGSRLYSPAERRSGFGLQRRNVRQSVACGTRRTQYTGRDLGQPRVSEDGRAALALTAAEMGEFEWDLKRDVFLVSERMAAITGVPAGEHAARGGQASLDCRPSRRPADAARRRRRQHRPGRTL